MNVLWQTIVGSHIWGQERPDSDLDLYTVYLAPTRDILLGHNTKRYSGGKHLKRTGEDGKEVDEVQFELGHVVKLLLKGNVNHLLGVLSPRVTRDGPLLGCLREVTLANLARNCYHSIHGMAVKNIHVWHRKGLKFNNPSKKLNTIGRTLQFGIKVLQGEKRDLFDVERVETMKGVEELMSRLDRALEESELPGEPDPEPFEEILLRARVQDM
ncbi:MAG: DNA polymerase beta superfamily protein [Promethearchaeota archaeon]